MVHHNVHFIKIMLTFIKIVYLSDFKEVFMVTFW